MSTMPITKEPEVAKKISAPARKQSYSQYGEDREILKLFGSQRGTCAEVGAFDGISLSNSYLLEKAGWECVLVEPNPLLCHQIRETRKARLFENAATSAELELDLMIGIGAEELSSVATTTNARERIVQEGHGVYTVRVKGRPLDKILDEAAIGHLDVITIDVEGHELEALKGLSLSRWRPRILIIEDNSFMMDDRVAKYLSQYGYVRFKRTGYNDWYAQHNDRQCVNFKTIFLLRISDAACLARNYLPKPVRRLLSRAYRLATGRGWNQPLNFA